MKFALSLLCVLSVSAVFAQQEQPPSQYGLSDKQVAEMGFERWVAYSYERNPGLSSTLGMRTMMAIYRDAAANENDALLAAASPLVRENRALLRKRLHDYSNLVAQLDYDLSGGGTLYLLRFENGGAEVEELIYRIQTNRTPTAPARVVSTVTRRIEGLVRALPQSFEARNLTREAAIKQIQVMRWMFLEQIAPLLGNEGRTISDATLDWLYRETQLTSLDGG